MNPASSSTSGGTLPTAARLAEHLEAHAPRSAKPWVRYVPLGVVVLAVLLSLAMPNGLTATLPWLALLGVIVYGTQRRQRHARASAQALYAQELGMLRYHRDALRTAWNVLPALVHRNEEHARTVALIGHLLNVLGADEAANVAFDFLLERLADGHPAALTLRLQKAANAFEADRLSDGDAELRRVRSAVKADDPGPIGAAYRATRLLQSVSTHHFAEAVDDLPQTKGAFRPLGIDGGLAYGLLAYAQHRLGNREASQRAWHDATCLLPSHELIRRYAPLQALAEVKP
ncbi:MAG: hypothetical protein AAGJ38_00760 [Planctomycetota bacterium]